MQEDRRAFGIDAHREIVAHDLDRVAANLVTLGQARGVRMHVGDDEVAVVTALQLNTPLHTANPMSKMKASSRRVAGQNARLVGIR